MIKEIINLGGYGQFAGEMPTGTLPDEILEPGPGRVRALISHGGNPVSAIPDIEKVERAFEALDLLEGGYHVFPVADAISSRSPKTSTNLWEIL